MELASTIDPQVYDEYFLDTIIPEKLETIVIIGHNKTPVILKQCSYRYPRLVICRIIKKDSQKYIQRPIKPKFLVGHSNNYGNGLFLSDHNFYGLDDMSEDELQGEFQMPSLTTFGQTMIDEMYHTVFEIHCPYGSNFRVLGYNIDLDTEFDNINVEIYDSNINIRPSTHCLDANLRCSGSLLGLEYSLEDGLRQSEKDDEYFVEQEKMILTTLKRQSLDWDRYYFQSNAKWRNSLVSQPDRLVGDSAFNAEIEGKSSQTIEFLNMDQLLVDTSSLNRSMIIIEPQDPYKDYFTIDIINDNEYSLFIEKGFGKDGLQKVKIRDWTTVNDDKNSIDDRELLRSYSRDNLKIKIVIKAPRPIRLFSNGDIYSQIKLREVLAIGNSLELAEGAKSIRLINCQAVIVGGVCPKFTIFDSDLTQEQICTVFYHQWQIHNALEANAKIILEDRKNQFLDLFYEESHLELA